MTNKQRVLDYLRSIVPNGATNEEIVSNTGVRPHQTVFQITRHLRDAGALKGVRAGKEWRFWYAGKEGNRALLAKQLDPSTIRQTLAFLPTSPTETTAQQQRSATPSQWQSRSERESRR